MIQALKRPSKITATLKIIEAEFPADVVAALEAYIEELEAAQIGFLPENAASDISETNLPPVWSHQRMKTREAHIRERALKKIDHYRQK